MKKQNFDKKVFINRLSRICGEDIIIDKSRLAVYEADGLTAKKQLPFRQAHACLKSMSPEISANSEPYFSCAKHPSR